MNSELQLRKATEKDVDLIFAWANDADVRKNSFNQQPIPYENHCRWFEAKMASSESVIFICQNGSEPVGQVRLDIIEDGEVLISYMIDKNSRGKGYAYNMLKMLEDMKLDEFLRTANGVSKLVAEVKDDNKASARVFEKLGYDKRIEDKVVIFTKSYK